MTGERVQIYQTYYKEGQKRHLDSCFVPLDVSSNTSPHLREYPIYFDLYERGVHREYDYVGLFSYKFGAKARLTGRQVLDFIRENPGHDVYVFNPYPQIAYFSFNIWEQGEYFHEGITEAAIDLLRRTGVDDIISCHGRDREEDLLFCNFWVGNRRFWDVYIPFLKGLHEAIVHDVDGRRRSRYLTKTFYFSDSPLYPFLFERMFTTYVKSGLGAGVSVMPYRRTYDDILECCTTVVERRVVEQVYGMVSGWDRESVYTEERRMMFRAMLAATGEYEKLLMKTGVHPYLF